MALKNSRYLAFDGLRGVAAFVVVLFHFCQISCPYVFPLGGMAVDFFFLLSGFVVALAYENRLKAGMPIHDFLRLRLIRLYPMLVLGIALGTIGYFRAYSSQSIIVNCLTALLFLPSPMSTSAEAFPAVPANPPEWSLIFELFGSIAYGLLAPKLNNRTLSYSIILSFFCYELAFYLNEGANSGYSWPRFAGGVPRFALSFGLGIAIMRLTKAGKFDFLSWQNSWIALAGVLLICFKIEVPSRFLWIYSSVLVIIIFPLVVVAGSFAQVTGGSASFCRLAGELSYPLYILQGGFVPHIRNLPKKLGLNNIEAIALITLMTVIYTVFVYIVWRFLDAPLRRKLLEKSFFKIKYSLPRSRAEFYPLMLPSNRKKQH